MSKTPADNYVYYTYADLRERRIVTSRTQLHFLIKDSDFPRPIKRGKYMQSPAFWRRSDVHAWLDRENVAAE